MDTSIKSINSLIVNNIPLFEFKTKRIRSKKFNKILDDIRLAPNYKEIKNKTGEKIYCFSINTMEEYIEYNNKLLYVVSYFKDKKNSTINVEGNQMGKYLITFRNFQNKMNMYIGNTTGFSCGINTHDGVGINILNINEIKNGDIVFYPPYWGTFFAFADRYKRKPFFCKCQKQSIINFVKTYSDSKWKIIQKEFPGEVIKRITSIDELLTKFDFKNNVCHKCNIIMPNYLLINPMYSGNKFKQKCNAYINQKYLEYGFLLPKHQQNVSPKISNQFDIKLLKNIETIDELQLFLENETRKDFKINNKGENWLNETYMANLIKKIFPEEKMIRHARPDWLSGLELDVYLPNLKIAFEYNGIQHYEPVEFFGGMKAFKKQIKRDKLKKEICKTLNIKLITIRYDDELSINSLRKRILHK